MRLRVYEVIAKADEAFEREHRILAHIPRAARALFMRRRAADQEERDQTGRYGGRPTTPLHWTLVQ